MHICKAVITFSLVVVALGAVGCAPAGDGDGDGSGSGQGSYTGSAGSGGGGLFGRDAFNGDGASDDASQDEEYDGDYDGGNNVGNNSEAQPGREEWSEDEWSEAGNNESGVETLGDLNQEQQRALCDATFGVVYQELGEENLNRLVCTLLGIALEEQGAGGCEEQSSLCEEDPQAFGIDPTTDLTEDCFLVGSTCGVSVDEVEFCLEAAAQTWYEAASAVSCSDGDDALELLDVSQLPACQGVAQACPELF
jgi:hypothetical protein